MPFKTVDGENVDRDKTELLRQNEGMGEIAEAFDIIGPPRMLMVKHFDSILSDNPLDSRTKGFIRVLSEGDFTNEEYIAAKEAFMILKDMKHGDIHYRHDDFLSVSNTYADMEEDYIVCLGDIDAEFGEEIERYIRDGAYFDGKVYIFEGFKDRDVRKLERDMYGAGTYYGNVKDAKFYIYDSSKMRVRVVPGSLFGEYYDESGTRAFVVEDGETVVAILNFSEARRLGKLELKKIADITKAKAEKVYEKFDSSYEGDAESQNRDYVEIALGKSNVNEYQGRPLVVIGTLREGSRFMLITSSSKAWEAYLDDSPVSFSIENYPGINGVKDGVYEIKSSSFQKIVDNSSLE